MRNLKFCVLAIAFLAAGVRADEASNRRANALYQSLTNGIPLLSDNPLYSPVRALVEQNDMAGAAHLITDPVSGAKEFYNSFVAGIPQSWNREDNIVGERNELSALLLGTIRDGHPIREILTQDRTYFDPTITDKNSFVSDPVTHFKLVWDTKSPREALRAKNKPNFPGVGIFTTHPWAASYLDAGTNRRPIYGVLHHLYCSPIQAVQTLVIPDKYVKRDVPRAPGGDPHQYLNNCISCHAFMDALIPRAFSRFDFLENRLGFNLPKDKLNEINYPESPITDETWHLFFTDEMNTTFGFRSEPNRAIQEYAGTGLRYLEGSGLKEFGEVVGSSEGFYRCLVKQLVSKIYLRKQYNIKDLGTADLSALSSQQKIIDEQAQQLKDTQDLRKTIESLAVHYTK